MNSQFVARCAASAREFTHPANRTACRGARMTGAFLCSVFLTAGTPGLSQTRSQTPGTVVGWGEQVIPYVAPGTRFTAIAAGVGHCLALKSDGTVVAWGDNEYGQSAVPAGLSGVVAMAAGFDHSLALKSDGTVVAWGGNEYGQSAVPAGLSGVVAVAAGGSRSLAIVAQPQGQAKPINVSPQNLATNVSPTAELRWADGGASSNYDVYFGTNGVGLSFKTNQTSTAYDAGTLAYNTAYYWRIDARNAAGATTGDVWTFATAPAAVQGASSGVRTNGFGFTVGGITNLVTVVEACTNLANPVWSPVATNTLGGGPLYFSDPQWTNYPSRFYRLRSP